MDYTEEIEKLKPWYQTLKFPDGTIVKGQGGRECWTQVRNVMTSNSLKGKRILDVGANAGLHSFRMAVEGAEVHSIEPINLYNRQFYFLRRIFEKEYGPLNVTLYKGFAEEMQELPIQKYDFVLAISILYHIGKHTVPSRNKEGVARARRKVVKDICSMAPVVVVRTRTVENQTIDDNMFNDNGFKPDKVDKSNRIITRYVRS
jgi:2-polyprenyl-3-methyl-5-hydroxy-6-metoxy-1,4-benzoquinol methylase